jgi:hypothetical protein
MAGPKILYGRKPLSSFFSPVYPWFSVLSVSNQFDFQEDVWFSDPLSPERRLN